MTNLAQSKKILLLRCENGWLARDENDSSERGARFVFESTESLAKNLVKLLGKSGWKVEAKLPERDDKGHFLNITTKQKETP